MNESTSIFDRTPIILPLSASNLETLQALISAYQELFKANGGPALSSLRNVAYTAGVQTHDDCRLAVVGQSGNELFICLQAFLDGETRPGLSFGIDAPNQRPKIAFVFSGQGSQWMGMGQDLLEREPVFRDTIRQCDRLIQQHEGWSLLAQIAAGERESRLAEVDVFQPTIFAIQVSLAALWRSWGVAPDAVVGHSIGEVAAACVAGALSLEDGVRVICHQSRLAKRVHGEGGMAVIGLPAERVRETLAGYEDRVVIGANNSPTSTVLSGEPAAVARVIDALSGRDIFCRWVKTDVASHSPQMEPLRQALIESLDGLYPQASSVPIYSTVTGRVADGLVFDADYWGRSLVEPVVFSAATQHLLADGYHIFLEISPHPILLSAIEQSAHLFDCTVATLPSLRRQEEEQFTMLESLGALFTLGIPLAWRMLYPSGQIVDLPTLVPQVSAPALSTQKQDILELIAHATAAERLPVVEGYLREQMSRVLGVSPTTLDETQSVCHLGIDSLQAVMLSNCIETDLGVLIPMVKFLGQASIAALTAQTLAALDAPTRDLLPSPAAQRHDESPLSAGQQALWAIYQMAPDSGAYNVATAMRVRSALDVSILQRALQALVDRHASLRTTFVFSHGEPVQRIHSQRAVFFRHEDGGSWSDDILKRQLAIRANQPFDLSTGPLLRAYLFTCADGEHVLLLVMHHIVTDFWSLTALVHELGVLYEAIAANESSALPPLKLQYTDYVCWHNDVMASPTGERLWQYWHEQLGKDAPILNLPTDWPRPPIQTYRGASRSCELDPELTQKLEQFSREQGVTPYTTLLATFQLLLHRYTGQEDVRVGSPAAGRNRAGFSDVVGYLANSIVLRADFSGTLSFAEFLAQMHHTVLGALAHQEYPFSTLVERLHPERDFSHSPLFQVYFILQQPHLLESENLAALILGVDGVEMAVGGLALESMSLEGQTSQFDLTLMVGKVKDRLVALMRYSTDLFKEATIDRMLAHWRALLESALANPDAPISRLSLLTKKRRQQLLVAWNDTARSYARDRCIHEMFEAQASQTPEAVAVLGAVGPSDGQLRSTTYRELNSRANQVARHLQTLGVGPGTLVGICMDRCTDVLTCILGILKAGGAYVPLDPNYPQERVRFMLQDAQASVLLTRENLRERLAAHSAHVVCVDTDWSAIARQDEDNLDCGASAEDLAYIIYTSGSTGKPKGVMISHANLWPYVQAMQEVMEITPDDRHLHTASFAFAASVRQFLVPLCTGASVVVATTEQIHDPIALFEAMQTHDVTIWGVVPSYWRHCINVLGKVAPEKQWDLLQNRLRLIVSASEPLWSDVPAAWAHDLGHDARLVNMLGQTEATGIIATYPIPPAQDQQLHIVPVGRPIANAHIYLLDRHMEPVPVGLPGEVYLGGAYIARGYHHRPRLTAERFILNPFADSDERDGKGGSRLYKTGDLARYRPDGTIEFLGRTDYQIKMRGYRIEPGEVEAVLAQHPGIREAVVMASVMGQAEVGQAQNARQMPEDKQLAAYVVAEGAAVPTVGELRAFVKERLPDYMIPSGFVFLEAFPLTPTGKIDRGALPELNESRQVDQVCVPPRNSVEEALVKMWIELLGVDQVGIYDNFFELGGHSLLAVQAMANLQDVFDIEDPLIAFFFEDPTIAGLAEALMQSEAGQGDVEEIAAILNLVSEMSDEEVESMLAELDGDAPSLGALEQVS